MFDLRSKTKWYCPPGKWFYGPTPLPSGISWASDPPTPLEFPIPSVVGVWIFSGTTQYHMESALSDIYALVVFISEISLVCCAHLFNFWYVNNSCVNTIRPHFPWRLVLYALHCYQSCVYSDETTWCPQWKIRHENLWKHDFRDSKFQNVPRCLGPNKLVPLVQVPKPPIIHYQPAT